MTCTCALHWLAAEYYAEFFLLSVSSLMALLCEWLSVGFPFSFSCHAVFDGAFGRFFSGGVELACFLIVGMVIIAFGKSVLRGRVLVGTFHLQFNDVLKSYPIYFLP